MNREFDEALQSCLDLIRGGRETIDSVVALYPEYADELRAQLEIATWLTSAGNSLNPRPGFVSASRRRLVSRIQQESRPPVPVPLTWGERLGQLFSAQKLAPVGFVLVLMLGLFVSGTVVSASQKAIPGDTLYSVKLTLEQIALATSLDDKSDAELQIQFVENRLTEVQALIVEERYDEVVETIQESTEQISKTLEIIQSVREENRFLAADLASQLDGILVKQRSILAVLSQNAPETINANIYRVWIVSEVVKLTVNDIAGIVPPPPAPPPTDVPTIAPTTTPGQDRRWRQLNHPRRRRPRPADHRQRSHRPIHRCRRTPRYRQTHLFRRPLRRCQPTLQHQRRLQPQQIRHLRPIPRRILRRPHPRRHQ